MCNCLDMREPVGSTLTSLQPLLDGASDVSGSGQVVRQQFGLPLGKLGKSCSRRRRRGRAVPAVGTQQGAIGGVLHQRMLEQIGRCGGTPRQNSSPASSNWARAAWRSGSGRCATPQSSHS